MAAMRRDLMLGHLQSLFSEGTACGLSDADLLERFATREGEASEFAFAVLVERHGPMVLRVCHHVLRDTHAAEDAFQAAFLVLARRARSLRAGASLAPWLQQVAWRTASRLRGKLARQRLRERRAAEAVRMPESDGNRAADLGEVLHEELGYLPAKYRVPLVLCYLEGMTSEQAARQLGWPAGTVRSRLARGRARLRARLIHRGLAPSAAAVVATLSSTPAEASVPWALAELTARAAVHVAGRNLTAGAIPASVVALSEEVLRAMSMIKLTAMAAVAAVGLATTALALAHPPGGNPTSPITALGRPGDPLTARGENGNQGKAAVAPALVASGGGAGQGDSGAVLQTNAASDVQRESVVPSPSPPEHATLMDRAECARKLAELAEADRRELRVDAWAIGSKLAQLPPDEGFSLLKENWDKLPRAETRQQLLSAWYHTEPYPLRPRNHPRLLDALDLGVRDRSPAVQNWALRILRWVAFQDFAENLQAYEPWYQANRRKPLATVIADSVKRFVDEASLAKETKALNRAQLLSDNRATFRDVPVARQSAVDAGLLRILERWTTSGAKAGAPEVESELAEQALGVILLLKPDQPYLRRVVVPLLAKDQPIKLRAGALRALGDKQNTWAVDLLLDVLKRGLEENDPLTFSSLVSGAASALAEIDDPKAVPVMIAVIDADNTSGTIYGIGHFGLGPLTGVRYDDNHNGAWWRQWWDKNKGRYPEGVRRLRIPKLTRGLKGGLAP